MSLLPRCAWLAMTLALACLHPLDAPARAQTKPNIVFVLADDLEQHGVNAMPRLQQLADVGTTFTRAFVSTPICAPSRATLLTGKYPQNTNTRSNRPPSGGYQNFYTSGQENETFGIWLQRAGYRTALVGKYMNFYPASAPALHVPTGWDFWAVPEQTHVHAKFGIKLNENGRYVQYGTGAEDYATDLYARLAAAFINASADAGTPFALFLSLNSPHNPFDPAPRHAHLFADARAPRLPSFPEYDTSDKPPFFRLPLLTEPRIAELDDIYARRLRMLRSVDEAIGGLRDLLRQRGLLEDTYFVFSSDNGWHTGHHNQMPMKGRPHEEDIRVPLVVTGPGVPAGRQISRLISNADIAPTFAAWGGAGCQRTSTAARSRSSSRLLVRTWSPGATGCRSCARSRAGKCARRGPTRRCARATAARMAASPTCPARACFGPSSAVSVAIATPTSSMRPVTSSSTTTTRTRTSSTTSPAEWRPRCGRASDRPRPR